MTDIIVCKVRFFSRRLKLSDDLHLLNYASCILLTVLCKLRYPPFKQNFQGHGIRVPSVGSPGLSSPSTSQSLQLHNQPWLSSGSQGKPPLPSPPVRSITSMLSLQQRGQTPQQHHRSASTASQQPQPSSSQQPPSPSQPPQEHYGQQFPASRDPQSLSHQQQIPRGAGLGNQKGSSHTVVQPNPVQPVAPNRTVSAESGESCNRILTKRSIQELVTQVSIKVIFVNLRCFLIMVDIWILRKAIIWSSFFYHLRNICMLMYFRG